MTPFGLMYAPEDVTGAPRQLKYNVVPAGSAVNPGLNAVGTFEAEAFEMLAAYPTDGSPDCHVVPLTPMKAPGAFVPMFPVRTGIVLFCCSASIRPCCTSPANPLAAPRIREA